MLDTRRKFEVIWMTLMNVAHYHIMSCLPLRRDCTLNRRGALRMRQSSCEVFEGNESTCSVLVNAWLLSLVHNIIGQFSNMISVPYCSGSFSFN